MTREAIKRDYLHPLYSPNLSQERRLALQLKRVGESQDDDYGMEDPFEDPLPFEKIDEIFEILSRRIAAPFPLKISDDHTKWVKFQSKIKSQRRKS